MPPKPSLLQFNRHVSLVNKFLSNIRPSVEALATLSPSQAKSQAEYLGNSLNVELEDFNNFMNSYLNLETLPEGLSEEVLQHNVSGTRSIFSELQCIICRYLNVNMPLASSTGIITDSTFVSDNCNVLLPKFSLNKFSGSYTEFDSFYSRFETLIHNSKISDCYKFEYLLSQLEGPALDVVKHLPFTEESYSTALTILKNRFSNARRAISLHANKILALPTLNNSVSSIRNFLDQLNVHFNSLKNLLKSKHDLHVQDVIYVQYLLSKFPDDIREEFEHKYSKAELPSLDNVLEFLDSHVNALENAARENSFDSISQNNEVGNSKSRNFNIKKKNKNFNNKSLSSLSTSLVQDKCVVCLSDGHLVSKCKNFLNLSPRERFNVIKSKHLCVKCLSSHSGHCKIALKCQECNKPHNTLLHFPVEVSSVPNEVIPQPSVSHGGEAICMTSTELSPRRTTVLMATALVRLQVSPTQYVIVKAILDSASHCSFVSEHVVQTLGCSRSPCTVAVSGIGRSSTSSHGQCVVSVCNIAGKIISPSSSFLILPDIALDTPREPVSTEVLELTKCFALADPTFHIPSRVDALLGADLVAKSLLGSVTSLGDGMPVVVLSAFGSVLMGAAPKVTHCSAVTSVCTPDPQTCLPCSTSGLSPFVSLVTLMKEDLNEAVHRFWSIEEPPMIRKLSAAEKLCEKYFLDTTVRLSTGRYQVRLPFIENGKQLLGNSYDCAVSRFHSLERRFKTDPAFKALYSDFMSDYLAKGHMSVISDPTYPRYLIPHHGVYKSHGDTSKIRVVFDASARSSSNRSLNSVLLDAPNMLNLLYDVLTLFRICPYVFICDIEQMYRQIRVHEEDRPFQCILWRFDEDSPIKVYSLNTVTYGVGPAAYLAIATLRRLAMDERHKFPKASKILLNKVFVDDISAGEYSTDGLLHLKDELISLLSSGGFVLKKWCSNSSELIHDLPPSHCTDPNMARILGLVWNLHSDSLEYPVDELLCSMDKGCTKRSILAQTAKLYDPCGYISPIVIYAKCFLQRLWRLNLDWDTPIPESLQIEWKDFYSSLNCLGIISIPRVLAISRNIQVHGFCDASKSAYAAVLYVRSQVHDSVYVNLVSSRTRVAPLRPTSIPRLELLGAHLLARLCHHYVNLLSAEYSVENVFLWTDSSIVLDWIHIDPYMLKTFVANRVAEITELTSKSSWRHLPGNLNPSDLPSRGVTCPSTLVSSTWFKGPHFLALDSSNWPSLPHSQEYDEGDLELKASSATLTASTSDVGLFDNISSWSRALGAMTYIIKWLYAFKKNNDLSPVQWRKLAVNYLAKYIQHSAFQVDIDALVHGRSPRAAIQRLAPFLDDNKIIRIRGRLTNVSNFSKNTCPILMPKHHHLVHLLIDHYHVWLGHAGPSLVQFHISWTYWILSARQVIRQKVHQCVACFRVNPRPSHPLMGDLPSVRVNPSPPFWFSGMDFCGPWLVKPYNLRKAPLVKVYLCIFICMSTKAVHIEVAYDLSAESFLDVLRRFIARRGKPHTLYSDCGTNFVGANTLLKRDLKNLLRSHCKSEIVKDFLISNYIEFRTIVPSGPHQGGLWERAVRSAKFHLKRIVGVHTLILSQLISLSAQIEAILNSRPLTPISADAEDYRALTPGHFLVGRPLTFPPEEDLVDVMDGSLRHHQLLRAMVQRFWKQWHMEYLTTLQARSKWTVKTKNLEVGDIVVISEPNAPPLMWPLGRVSSVSPGKDGVVRRATVTTHSGTLERPAVKLFRLPIVTDSSPNLTN